MKTTRYNKDRHEFGILHEVRLKPLIEQIIGEPLTKTKHFYNVMDYESPSYFIELKSRSQKYHPDNFPTWLIPSCKEQEAKKNKHKKTIFFYYWLAVDELYRLDYDPSLFESYHREIPWFHRERQEHIYCDKDDFQLVNSPFR